MATTDGGRTSIKPLFGGPRRGIDKSPGEVRPGAPLAAQFIHPCQDATRRRTSCGVTRPPKPTGTGAKSGTRPTPVTGVDRYLDESAPRFAGTGSFGVPVNLAAPQRPHHRRLCQGCDAPAPQIQGARSRRPLETNENPGPADSASSTCTMSSSHERYCEMLWIEGYASFSSSAFASLRSFVSKPSVNQA
jgi:hypothetical protein